MTVPDPPENFPPDGTLTQRLDRFLQDIFSEKDADLGAQYLGDWLVVAEVHTTDGPVLRLVNNSETPIWRQQGMLKFATDDLTHDVLVFRLRGEDEG